MQDNAEIISSRQVSLAAQLGEPELLPGTSAGQMKTVASADPTTRDKLAEGRSSAPHEILTPMGC